jgi:hypothetical protein
MTEVFTFISDPGHGWLEVTTADLETVGLSTASFSRYSYQHGHKLYLEEDCDAGRFIAAFQGRFGHMPKIADRFEQNTEIRNYRHIDEQTAAHRLLFGRT